MLSDDQINVSASILISAGQVFLASLIVPYFTGEYNAAILIAGILLTFGSWSIALVISQRNNIQP